MEEENTHTPLPEDRRAIHQQTKPDVHRIRTGSQRTHSFNDRKRGKMERKTRFLKAELL